ncbi:MAG: hypothetical protein OXI57_12685 [Rhodospirillales bacterium]|nr:hypothetical protein [Rhodospirillales bacterium]
MDASVASANPRLGILRQEVEGTVLIPFKSHGWSTRIVREIDSQDCIEVFAERDAVSTRIAVLYSSSGISYSDYGTLSQRVERIFFIGQPYMFDSFAGGATVPVEPLSDFFPYLVELNKRAAPDRSPPVIPHRAVTLRRLTAENPLDAVIARLQQFTSEGLARKLVNRRAEAVCKILSCETVAAKSTGIAYSMRSALDYLVSSPREALIRRVLGLYYGTMALAQAEMLASPSGPTDLGKVEDMTRYGHGLYALPASNGGFADLRVGVLKSGFFPQWMKFLGQDTSRYPNEKPRTEAALEKLPSDTFCLLRGLFASMPEIDDLFAEVFDDSPAWVSVAYDNKSNFPNLIRHTAKKSGSTYGLFVDRSGKISAQRLENAGWPLAEIRRVDDFEGSGVAFRARVDHAGHDIWWKVLPTHSSPFFGGPTLLLPTVGGICEYRTIAAATLYALSIIARYMPSAWRRIEGGDEDQYLALVQTSLAVWERLLPEHFLESIAGESVRTAQPGSWLA